MTSTTPTTDTAPSPTWRTIDPRAVNNFCDQCNSARALVTALIESPNSRGGTAQFSFCAHHYRQTEASLASRILDIHDSRDGTMGY